MYKNVGLIRNKDRENAVFHAEQDELVSNYYENIVHDLKTPLFIASASILKAQGVGGVPSPAREAILDAKKSLDRLEDLLSALSRPPNLRGLKGCVKYTNYDLISFFEGLTDSMRGVAERRGISLVFDTNVNEAQGGLEKSLTERAALNLISNALKYSPEGSTVLVCLKFKRKLYTLSVCDEGPGIRDKRLFKRYHSGIGSGGTGLGLDIVRHIAETLGGKLKYRKRPSGGSVFSLILPRIPE